MISDIFKRKNNTIYKIKDYILSKGINSRLGKNLFGIASILWVGQCFAS